MEIKLNDQEIKELILEKKQFPKEWHTIFQMKDKKGHKEKEIRIPRNDGSLLKIILRQNMINPLDFSIILGYMTPKSSMLFRLIRYNGKSHQHTNKIEKHYFYDFHIHRATVKYQESGFKEDGYAEITNSYSDINSAWDCFIKECNLVFPEDNQMSLFGKE